MRKVCDIRASILRSSIALAVRAGWVLIVCCFIAWPQIGVGQQTVGSNQEIKPMSVEKVGIAPNAIRIPKGIILLVHRNSEYCAVKFTKFWTGKTKDDEYATYESYYQNDKAVNFKGKNVQFKKGELSRPRLRGIGRFSFSFGKLDIRCGPIKLFWSGKGWVYFFSSNQKQGDYGIELAPTEWTNIEEVDVFDSRLRWYRYDEARERADIPINQLWTHEDLPPP